MNHEVDIHTKLEVVTLLENRTNLLYKVLNDIILDCCISNMFETPDLIHEVDRKVMARSDIVVREICIMFGERAFSVFDTRYWNVLPNSLRSNRSLNVFVNGYHKLFA